ncbi:MAG TPA: ribbon-helix-helix domain-containing protein [Firmicutes bacterium]|nr:ribbon-helix-helix domain-containing protein [Candidatus Fermentithermobacillaceae bacterium]
MVRTQIQLTEEQAKKLKMKAAAMGVSMAELIRQGVDLVLEFNGDKAQPERVRRAMSVVGRFRSDKTDVAVKHDKYLAEAAKK